MDGQTAKFVAYLKSLSDYSKVFADTVIDKWANGLQGSESLNRLYADFQAGNLDNIANWVRGEAGDNLNAPGWVNYKQPGISPEIAFLQTAISQTQQNKANYIAAGGEDTALLESITFHIAALEETLKEYQDQQAADLKAAGN